jgi:hypothetical protein
LHPAGTREQSAGISTPKQLSTWSMSDTPGNCIIIKVPGYLEVNSPLQILKSKMQEQTNTSVNTILWHVNPNWLLTYGM